MNTYQLLSFILALLLLIMVMHAYLFPSYYYQEDYKDNIYLLFLSYQGYIYFTCFFLSFIIILYRKEQFIKNNKKMGKKIKKFIKSLTNKLDKGA